MNLIIYLIIFLEKLLESILTSLRTIIYTNGHKHLSALLTFITTLMWIVVTSIVIIDVKEDPLKLLIYAFGQMIGVYLGAKLESKLALGNSLIYAVAPKASENKLCYDLRANGYGVTTINAKGYDAEEKIFLLIVCKRNKIPHLKKVINDSDNQTVLMFKKITSTSGGFISMG